MFAVQFAVSSPLNVLRYFIVPPFRPCAYCTSRDSMLQRSELMFTVALDFLESFVQNGSKFLNHSAISSERNNTVICLIPDLTAALVAALPADFIPSIPNPLRLVVSARSAAPPAPVNGYQVHHRLKITCSLPDGSVPSYHSSAALYLHQLLGLFRNFCRSGARISLR